jgi:hypothetical protein
LPMLFNFTQIALVQKTGCLVATSFVEQQFLKVP